MLLYFITPYYWLAQYQYLSGQLYIFVYISSGGFFSFSLAQYFYKIAIHKPYLEGICASRYSQPVLYRQRLIKSIYIDKANRHNPSLVLPNLLYNRFCSLYNLGSLYSPYSLYSLYWTSQLNAPFLYFPAAKYQVYILLLSLKLVIYRPLLDILKLNKSGSY